MSLTETIFLGAVIVVVWHGLHRFFFPMGPAGGPRRDKCLACLSPEAAQPEAAQPGVSQDEATRDGAARLLPHQRDAHPGGGHSGPSGGGFKGV